MKHFLWYDSEGCLHGDIRITRGWEADDDISDAGTSNPILADLRDNARLANGVNGYVNHPDFAGFYTYDCPCARDLEYCDCCSDRIAGQYLDLGEDPPILRDKHNYEVHLDDVSMTFNNRNNPDVRTPGTTIVLKLHSPTPDVLSGVIMKIDSHRLSTGPDMADYNTDLIFGSTDTNTLSLTVPLAGFVSGIAIYPTSRKLTMPVEYWIKGSI